VPVDFNVREATKGLKSPNAQPPAKKIQVKYRVDPLTILKKLLPYVSADDDELTEIELAKQIHDRVKDDDR
jgi:hypothetical protein